MFNLFKKEGQTVKVIDKIWMTKEAKWNGLVRLWQKQSELVIVAWFDSTLRDLESLFTKNDSTPPSLFVARAVHSSQLAGRNIIFAEHHPLRTREQQSFNDWHLKEAIVHSSLDEPLFKHFGSDKIIAMMKQLGMDDNSAVEHKLISGAITNAQEKIGKKVVSEQSASSQEEWMQRNL